MFGDGSVTIISTPGHTPGHQSLLVQPAADRLAGAERRCGHFKDNWDNKRVASMNTSADQTQASYKRIEDLLAREEGAALDQPRQAAKRRPRSARRNSTIECLLGAPLSGAALPSDCHSP